MTTKTDEEHWSIRDIRAVVDVLSQRPLPPNIQTDAKLVAFAKRYPMLFDMSTSERGIDPNVLDMMLSALLEVRSESISQEKASEHVGTSLFEKFIKPRLANQKNKTATIQAEEA